MQKVAIWYFIALMNSQNTTLSVPRKWGPWSFYQRALAIAIPVMAQALIQSLVSLVDNFMVSGLGDIKMSGVNIAGQINFIYMMTLNSLIGGAGIFMSQYNGAKDPDGMKQVLRYKLVAAILFGILYTTFCAMSPKGVIGMMVHGNAQSTEILEQAVRYERAQALQWLFFGISLSFASSFREIGMVNVPLIISSVSTLINTIGNFILIYGNFGAPRMEVAGAALATVIARGFEALAFIIYALVTRPPFFGKLKDLLRIPPRLIGLIISKSTLMLVSDVSWVLTETITTALYNSRGGAEIVSGMSAGFAIANLFYTCFNGIFASIGVILGGTLGAGKLDEARAQKGWLLRGSIVLGLVFGGIGAFTVFLIPIVYMRLSPEAQACTRALVLVNAAYMWLWCYLNALYAISRTGGDAFMGAAIDVVGNTFACLPLMFALTYLTPMGPVLLYATVKLIDVPKCMFGTWWLKKEKWVVNLTE